MAKTYVFSTLANDQRYQNWVIGGNDVPMKSHSVLIKGGSGVANDRLVTPFGVVTEVTEHDLEELKKNISFSNHEKKGFIVVRNKKAEVEKIASEMNLKDESSPLTHKDYISEEDSPKYKS